MIKYMEQYVITSYSGVTHDPAQVPSCQLPDVRSCDSMMCKWKDGWGTPIYHTYQFQRCSKPQAVHMILEAGLHHYEWWWDQSTLVKVNMTMSLNVTVKHPSSSTLGFQVFTAGAIVLFGFALLTFVAFKPKTK